MTRATDYDSFAAGYSADNETNLINSYYERPAMLGLLGDVDGRRVLDAGCGSGPLAAALQARGATVSGFDASQAMIDLARQRLGTGADLRVADLARPLPYPDRYVDDVAASLVLHYLEDWTAPLNELHRVLEPGGRLILSVHHPIVHKILHPESDYFAVTEWTDSYTFAGEPATLTYWHRPLHAMTDAFTAAGFRIAVISEPPVAPDTPSELLPPQLDGRRSFLSFIFFVLEASTTRGPAAGSGS